MKWSPDLITGSSWGGKQPGGRPLYDVGDSNFSSNAASCIIYFHFIWAAWSFLKRSRRSVISSSFPLHRRLSAGGTFAGRLSFPRLVIAWARDSFMTVVSIRLLLPPPAALISAPETIHLPREGNKRAALLKLSLSRNRRNTISFFCFFLVYAFVYFLCMNALLC